MCVGVCVCACGPMEKGKGREQTQDEGVVSVLLPS